MLGTNFRCFNSHPLELCLGTYPGENDPDSGSDSDMDRTTICALCSLKSLEMHEFYYRCHQCSFIVCRPCALIKGGVLKKKQHFVHHEHPLER